MGKGAIFAVVILIAIVAVVAFIAYPMFFGDNKAVKLQPDVDAFPAGWKVDQSASASWSEGTTNKDWMSRERFVDAGETEHVVVQIYVFTTVEKANASYNGLKTSFGGGGSAWVPTGADIGFKSLQNDFYFQKGTVVVQILTSVPSTLTQTQIDSIATNIIGKI